MLQSDGYAAYEQVGGPKIVHAGCWAHARRKFFEALELHPDDRVARRIVARIDELFAIDAKRAPETSIGPRATLCASSKPGPCWIFSSRRSRRRVLTPYLPVRWPRLLTTRLRSGGNSRASWNIRSWN